MVNVLRTLQDYVRWRVGLECICDSCGGRWEVDIRQAIRALGGNARQEHIHGRARCPRCSSGRAIASDPVINRPKPNKPIYFPGAWEEVHSAEDPDA